MKSANVKMMLMEIADLFIEKRDELAKLDGVIGDGDHGISMARGAKAARECLLSMTDDEPVNEYFKNYGRSLIAEIGGAMGPLFGTIFTEFGKCCKVEESFNKESYRHGVINATDKIMEFGGAKKDDKTMVDAMIPAKNYLVEVDLTAITFADLCAEAANCAHQGMLATIPLKAKKGRSKFLQDKSIGHQDAGATSFYYLLSKIAEYVKENPND